MLARLSFLVRSSGRAYFCTFDEHQARQLTKDINYTNSASELRLIIIRNRGNLNLVHISALLKKINFKMPNEQQLLHTVYQEVKLILQNNTLPNARNSRAIANIIGYTGNQGYTGINEILRQINYHALFRFVNQKQFVMVVTGLLKLKLVEGLIDNKTLDSVVRDFVGKCQNIGLLISLWRNLIKWNHSNQGVNEVLMNKIIKCRPSQNIKDLGYLVYCYTESPHIKAEVPELTNKIRDWSLQYLYSTRINIFELSIFINHLVKISKIANLSVSSDIFQLLKGQYIRIVKGNIDLRSLANGYMSLISFEDKIDHEAYISTVERYVSLLDAEWENIKDYQSVTSLFFQLITTRSRKSSFKDHQFLIEEEIQSSLYLKSLLKPLKNFLFHPKTSHILNLSAKQYQKLLYSFYLYKKQGSTLEFSKEQVEKLTQSLLTKNQLSQLQITSIMSSFRMLELKTEQICRFLKAKLENLKELPKNECWVGLKERDCLGCFYKKDKEPL